MLDLPVWQFYSWGKAIRRDRVSDSIAMAQTIGLSLGGGKEIADSWKQTMEDPIVAPLKAVEVSPIEVKPRDKKAALQKLAKLFGEFG